MRSAADPTRARRVSTATWRVVAAVEVALAVGVVAKDLLLPTLLLLALAAASLAGRRQGVASLGLGPLRPSMHLVGGILGLVLAWTLVQLALVLPALEHLSGERQDLSGFEDLRGNLGLLVVLLVASWLLAALGEETAYRGYVLTRLREVCGGGRVGIVVAVLGSSALFGLAHTEQGLVGVLATFLDALFFSVLRLRAASGLWASVLAHGLNNTVGLTAYFFLGPIYGLW